MKEEKPTILDREEKKENEAEATLGGKCYIREVSLPNFETEIPAIVLSELGINLDEADGVEVQFIQENSGKIYIEKA